MGKEVYQGVHLDHYEGIGVANITRLFSSSTEFNLTLSTLTHYNIYLSAAGESAIH